MKLKLAITSMMLRKILLLPNTYLKCWKWFVIHDKSSVSCMILQISWFSFLFYFSLNFQEL